MRKSISNFQFYLRLKNKRIEAIGVSCCLHFFLIAMLLFSPKLSSFVLPLEKDEKDLDEELAERKILVRVEKVDVAKSEVRNDSQLISTESTFGLGQMERGRKQHVLGKAQYRGVASGKNSSLPREESFSKGSVEQGDLFEETPAKKNIKQIDTYENFAVNTDEKNYNNKSKEQLENSRREDTTSVQSSKLNAETEYKQFAVESSLDITQQFWFDENGILQLSANEDENAQFFLELAENISAAFMIYLRTHGTVNFYFLKKDFVRMLIKIDANGGVTYIHTIKKSTKQRYFNYLPEKVLQEVKGIGTALPKKQASKNANGEVYLEIGFYYSGRPLRRWWMGFDFAD